MIHTTIPYLDTDKVILGIDGDILLYKIGFASQKIEYKVGGVIHTWKPVGEESVPIITTHPLPIVYKFIRLTIDSYVNCIHPDKYYIVLSGANNFRMKLDGYKADRIKKPKPVLMPEIKQYLMDNYNCIIVPGIEADDVLATLLTEYPQFILGTIDKDLNQVPGWHFNLNKKELSYITEEEGRYSFWRQMVTGDPTDCVPGLLQNPEKENSRRYGNATADKLFLKKFGDEPQTDESYSVFVQSLYDIEFKCASSIHYNRNYTALRMLTTREACDERTRESQEGSKEK